MRRIAAITRNPVAIAIVAALAVAGCRSKSVPNSAADLGIGAGGYGAGGALGSAAPGSPQEFTVSVGDRIFFDTDSSVIRADAQATLIRQAQWLQRYPNYQITIEGHADERGTREYNLALGARRAAATRDFLILIEGHADERGTREYNIALGARRGSAVVNYLVSRGIPANRISSVSYGKERPVAICNDISCWSQNRRAVTVLTN